jgi:two-component system sensor histidine kinase KdpD
VAHDLKLPLSHIKGFVSSLRRDDLEWDEDTRQEFLADIEQEVDRLTRMIDSLMRSQTPQSGGAHDAKRTVSDPAAIVAEALQRIQPLLGERRVRMVIAPNLPRVRVDASQIERVLINLLQNAAKYASPSSPISIFVRMRGSELELAVDNDGPSISLQDQQRLFEPFFRDKAATQSGVPGHGLGLAICQSIALAHGGRMAVANRPGGMRFSMFVPLQPKPARDRKHVSEIRAA